MFVYIVNQSSVINLITKEAALFIIFGKKTKKILKTLSKINLSVLCVYDEKIFNPVTGDHAK